MKLKQMLRLLTVACLLAAAAAQRTYYCDSVVDNVVIRDSEFFLVTRNMANASYPQGLTCRFPAFSDTGFLLDIQEFRVSTAVLTITTLGNIVFKGSVLPTHRSSIATKSGILLVEFHATGDYSKLSGVTIRVRAFSSNQCPPGWVLLYGSCIGTSNMTGWLNYFDAQKACNSMRANLLHIPVSWFGNLRDFKRSLPASLRTNYTWIGLTDLTVSGQYTPYWLDGKREVSTTEISCVSGGRYQTCFSNERCGAFYDGEESYAIYMDKCNSLGNYACSMQPGGDFTFYAVPSGSSILPPPTIRPNRSNNNSSTNWGAIWGAVAGFVFVTSLIVSGIYSVMRSKSRRRAGATRVIVTTANVVAQPPPAVYYQPQQQPPHPLYPQGSGTAGAPPYPTPPPPAYNVAVSGGYGDAGYAK